MIRRAGSSDSAIDAKILATLGARTFTAAFGHLYAPRDLAAFLAEAHSVDRAATDLADPATGIWLAELDGVALGYVLAGPCGLPHPEVTPACGEIKRLYMLAQAQGSGVGARLFSTAMDWLAQTGRRTVWLGVWEENHGAQRFYRRHGFEKVGDYGFRVGATVDREHIYRCVPERDSG